ncbi:cytochrome P450 [Nocardia gipuzkoensis]|uniref:cytochrome P450 n=1 Tax=Nocardia gipuzkoensis TaxID=2749991 RepID=UPI00237E2605|nr:cytochrome P450 [Nocardia gipuzkoensis]MDE1671895.1 cytochrome P450 [Nocardia gipuzkoensis]
MTTPPRTGDRRLDGPAHRHPLGAYARYRADPLSLFYESALGYGSVRLRLAHQHVHLLVEPEHIEQVLVTHAGRYEKGISYRSLNHMLGPGLLTSGGELWKRQRALIKPAFARRHVETEIPLMVDCGQRLRTRLDARADDGAVFDLVPELMGFAADVVCRAVLGADLDGVLPQIEDDVRQGISWVMRHMAAPVQVPPRLPTPGNRRLHAVRRRLHRVVDEVILRHRQTDDAHSLLARLLAARDDAGHAMDDEQLRHEVLTFLLAGHETTGGALAWTIYELGRHPAVLERVRAEIDALPDAPDDPDAVRAALPRLEFTGRVIDEAMRLHPPAWAFSRTALEPDRFDRFDLRPGAIVVISPFVNHRLPRFWDAPLTFDPDRFTKERNRARPPFRYFPFGWGAHLCVGQQMALIEIRVGLAMLLSRYDIELVNGMRVRERPEISNTPDPVLVRLTRRERAVPATRARQEAAR